MGKSEAIVTTVSKRDNGLSLWLRRVLQRVMETREIEAKRRAAVYLSGLDNETIMRLGIDPRVVAELRRVHAGAGAAKPEGSTDRGNGIAGA